MSSEQYAVVLRQKVEGPMLGAVVASFVDQLGVKEKTAHQILQHIPLKVYSRLSFSEARVLVEALNVATCCQWEVMAESEVNFPAANWNKEPTVMGLELAELMRKNDPKATGVARYLASEGSGSIPKDVQASSEAEKDGEGFPEESILDSADTVLKNLSADLDKALYKDGGADVMQTQVLSDIPGGIKDREISSAPPLKSGFYNLYLPEVNDEEKNIVIEVARESLGMDEKQIEFILSKAIPCVVRNVDEKEAARLIGAFRAEGIFLKNRLRSKA